MSSLAPLRLVILGHVDHGKSTLIGRLLQDTGSVPADRIRDVEITCRKQGRPFEFAYLLDALEEEREQNITIETTETHVRTPERDFLIIDAPGHKQFLKNMITGAAAADAAILLLDAAEGLREQTRRHAYLTRVLSIEHVLVFVNKIDLVGFDAARFDELRRDITVFLAELGIRPLAVIPGSAREGISITRLDARLPWYRGPAVLESLRDIIPHAALHAAPLRLPLQDIYREEEHRIYAGRVEAGTLRAGDPIRFLPSGKSTRVKRILRWGDDTVAQAGPGQSIGLLLEDALFVERGEVIAAPETAPLIADAVEASIFWLSEQPLRAGAEVTIQTGTASVRATVNRITNILDSATLAVRAPRAEALQSLEAATLLLELARPLAVDTVAQGRALSRFVIVDGGRIGGGGLITVAHAAATRSVVQLEQEAFFGEDGSLDLRRYDGTTRFAASESFAARYRGIRRLAIRVRSLDHAEQLLRLAWQYEIASAFDREPRGIRVEWGRGTEHESRESSHDPRSLTATGGGQ